MRTGRKLKEEPIENRHRPEHELAAWSSARGKSWALLQFNKKQRLVGFKAQSWVFASS